MDSIYLDVAATSKYTNVDDIIVNTMTQSMRDDWMNPSSLYATKVKDKIDKCRKNIADFIVAKPEEVIFTSGASESNNAAIRGWVDQQLKEEMEWEDLPPFNYPHVITTQLEHKSITSLFGNLDAQMHFCKVDRFGMVDLDALRYWLEDYDGENMLVSIQYANNEIGTVQPIKEIADLVHRYKGVLHVDATQALPYIPIDVEKLGIDMMSCSGHKISPVLRGIGFLYKKKCINIQPLICGNQENGLRGGTENTYGIIGLSKALEYCDVSYERYEKMCSKRDYFIGLLENKFGCKLNGDRNKRLPNNINVTFSENIMGESLLYVLSMSNIFISTGSACNSHSIKPSYVLKEIGLSDEDAMRSVRFSLPEDITYEQINKVIIEIEKSLKLIGNN